MSRIISLILFVLFLWFDNFGQTTDQVEATFAFAKFQGSGSVQFAHLWTLGKKQKLSIGYGIRFSSYLGANQYYITAPAKLTSGSTGPLVIFKENIPNNIDTLLVKSPLLNMLNVSVNIQYQLTSRLSAGFNIDAFGFSFGGRKKANYINGFTGKNTDAKPTAFNLLLVSDNDLGSLNSEFFLRYQVRKKIGIKIGAQFMFTEYKTSTQVQQTPAANDRFRNKSLMVATGISYTLK